MKLSTASFIFLMCLFPLKGYSKDKPIDTRVSAETSSKTGKVQETEPGPADFFNYMEKNSKRFSRLYIPKERFLYKKVRVDSGLSYVTAPIQHKYSSFKRKLSYPEGKIAVEYWQEKHLGFHVEGSAGVIMADSGDRDRLFYYPTTINASMKYKIAAEYSVTSPFFNLELGLHYHDLNVEVLRVELVQRVYKGPYIGIERKIPLGQDLGFFFEINFMPYLVSSGFFDSNDVANRSMGIHFLASAYFTAKFKKSDKTFYRLKIFGGFARRDYFTDVKDSSIVKSRLDQRYQSFFLIASQEI